MDFSYSDKVRGLQERMTGFMQAYVYPAERRFHEEVEHNRRSGDAWRPTAVMEELKQRARAETLWNLFLPDSQFGAGLSNLEYAPVV